MDESLVLGFRKLPGKYVVSYVERTRNFVPMFRQAPYDFQIFQLQQQHATGQREMGWEADDKGACMDQARDEQQYSICKQQSTLSSSLRPLMHISGDQILGLGKLHTLIKFD